MIYIMKYIKFIMVALVAAFISLGAYAQEDNNRDANGYVVRGPYLTNGGMANWFVGIGGGVNTSLAKGVVPFSEFNIANNWGAELFVGKWFTPTIGARIGYKGVMNNFGYDTEKYISPVYVNGEQVRIGYAHIDLMWNLSDALGGYKETRFWDIVPYIGAGYLGINNGSTDNKVGVSAGIYNKLRLGSVVDLFLDVNIIGTENPLGLRYVEDGAPVVTNETNVFVRPLYMPTATVGFAFNLSKKRNFDRFSSVGVYKTDYDKLYNDCKELQSRIGALESENSTLKNELIECQKKAPDVKEVIVEKTKVLVGSNIITFPFDSHELSNTEAAKVAEFAKSLDNETLIQIVGSADSKTGGKTYNEKLAGQRADVVKEALVKAGISADRISTSSTLDATDNVKTSRSAILTIVVE